MAKERVSKTESRYFSKLQQLFFHPKKFVESISQEKNYQEIMFFYVKTYLWITILTTIITALILRSNNPTSTGGMVLNIIVGLIFAFLTPFILATIIHLGVLIFGGRQGYFNTYKPSTYGAALGMPYGIITSILGASLMLRIGTSQITSAFTSPEYIGLMIVFTIQMIHVFYFEITALAKYQKLSRMKAFLSIILVLLALVILAAIFAFLTPFILSTIQ